MITSDPFLASCECGQMLALLSRFDAQPDVSPLLKDAAEIAALLSLYSFRSGAQGDSLCAEISSRYRSEILEIYGFAVLSRRQSSSTYLRLEHLLGMLVRVALLRLVRAGMLSLSMTQLTLGDGILLQLVTENIRNRSVESSARHPFASVSVSAP